MKTEDLIRVVDRELDSLRYNIKAIRDRKTWTEETEAIFLSFRHEEEALQEIRTILNRMLDEEGELHGESQKPCKIWIGFTGGMIVESVLWLIYSALLCLLICKDMSGKDELREIKRHLKRIADRMEGEKKDGMYRR